MSELDLGGEHGRTGTNAPCHQGLLDLARLERFTDPILLNSSDLAEEDKLLDVGICLKAQQMLQESGARIPVASNGHSFVDTVCIAGNDVVQLIAHATRTRNVRDASWTIQLRGQHVVDHSASVANPEAARFDAPDRGRADDQHSCLFRLDNELASQVLGDALGNNGDCFDLWELQGLQGRVVRRTEGSKIDQHVDSLVSLHGFRHALVDGKHDFLSAEVKLLHVVSAEGINHARHGRFAAAAEVEIKHALSCARLHSKEQTLRVARECSVWNINELLWWTHCGVSVHANIAKSRVSECESIAARNLLETQGHRANRCHVCFRSEDVHGQIKLRSEILDVTESFLVVGSSAANKDLDAVLLQLVGILAESTTNALESVRNVGEIGNPSSNNQDFALLVDFTGHEAHDGLGVLVGLRFAWSTGVLTVVGQLAGTTQIADGIAVDDRGTTACHHGPDPAFRVQDRQLE
eukprot:m.278177 g.278177  ORF g.278177 m.278177 type:complete len:466 (+) comp54882_c0_seq10:1212-2609(+)